MIKRELMSLLQIYEFKNLPKFENLFTVLSTPWTDAI